MDKVIDDGIRVNLRMRFTCTVYRAIAPEEAARANAKGKTRKAIKKPGGEILMSQVDKGGWEALEGPSRSDGEGGDVVVEGRDKEIMCFSTRPVEQFEVLNDLVVDRGPSPFVSLLELFGELQKNGKLGIADNRGRASPDDCPSRRTDSLHPDRLDGLLPLGGWIACAPSNPCYPHHADLSAYFVFQADVVARQYGAAYLRTVQLAKHGLGEFRRSWKG